QPTVAAGERKLDRRRRVVPGTGLHGAAVRQGYGLAAAAALDPDRHGDGEAAVAGGDHLGLAGLVDQDLIHATASSTVSGVGSGRRSRASTSMPLGRNRTSMSFGETITLSMRSRTMRCCSTGKS